MAAARDALLLRVMDDVTEHGLSDRSLRDLAASIGTSHRLLIYHFGSREGLVAAVVTEVEAAERAALSELAATIHDPIELVRAMWQRVSAPDVRPFVRLFFEALTSARANDQVTESWLAESEAVTGRLGVGEGFDRVDVRLGVAVIRGLLVDVVATGDVAQADAALERFLAMWQQR